MYRHIATTFPLAFPYKDFLKVESVFFKSDIEKKLGNGGGKGLYNFLTEINAYSGDTYFIGYGDKKKWISLNLIEGSDRLFLHTTLKDASGTLQDVSQNYAKQGFTTNQGNCKLYEVGKISDTEQNLIVLVNNIVANLK